MSSNEYIDLDSDSDNIIEVQDIRVRISVSAILQECEEEQLIGALVDQGFAGWVGSDDDERKEAAMVTALEDAAANDLWAALKDKPTLDLLDILDEANELERAARRWLDALSPDDLQAFLVQHAYIPRPASELAFIADNPSDAVYWVKVRDPDYTVGMVLPDLSNVFEGRAKLRMFVNTADDSGWVDCETLAKAQRMARMLFAGRGASAGLDPAERLNIHLDAVISASARANGGAA
jgi:hypothetical protein